MFGAFPEQVPPFDSTAAGMYADVVANRERAGNPIDGFDAQIASVCRVHRARLATRNVKDFRDTGVEAIDPWRDDGKSWSRPGDRSACQSSMAADAATPGI